MLRRTGVWNFLLATGAVIAIFISLRAEAAGGCADGGPVYITNFVVTPVPGQGPSVHFEIAGGASNVLYDILVSGSPVSTNVAASTWTILGQGYACNTCFFTNQPTGMALYALSVHPSFPVYLTNFVAIFSTNLGMSVRLDIGGGDTNNGWYNLVASTNRADGASADWTWVAQGLPRKTYSLNMQPPGRALYAIGNTPATLIAAWGDNSHGQCEVPPGITNAVAVTGGNDFSVALRGDGTVIAWGDNSHGQTNVPPGLNKVVAIAAGPYHALALRADGTVVAWGSWSTTAGFTLQTASLGFTNAIAIAANGDHDLVLKADGKVVSWGPATDVYNTVPTNLPPVSTLVAGWNHNVALTPNGGVVAWGINGAALGWNLTTLPPGLTNVVRAAAFALHTVALRGNGTVAAWGYNADGQINVPAGLSNVVSVTAGKSYSAALQRDGTVVLWGTFGAGKPVSAPYQLSGVMGIGSGASHCLAICTARSKPLILDQPATQSQVYGGTATFTAKGAGVGAVNYQWQCNGTNILGATNSTLILTNLDGAAVGTYRVVISNGAGSVTSSNAQLAVNPLSPPIVTSFTRPSRIWVNAQSDLLLSLTVSDPAGLPPTSCQWKFNGTNRPPNQATPYSYKVYSVDSTEEGTYSAVLSNEAGIRQLDWVVRAAFPGGVASWGANNLGQSDRPASVTSNVLALAGGASNSVAVMADGTVRQWGYNWADPPANLTNVVAVSAGYSHTLALRSDGTMVAWGDAAAPANWAPSFVTGVKAIAAGWNHNVALGSNGLVTAWGFNGTAFGWHLTEVPAGLNSVRAIATGSLHSLALRTNGTVVSWGFSPDGETNVPPGLSNVVAVAGGGQHSLALKADGTVVAWGFNGSGQCTVPAGLNNVIDIAAGWAHSIALKNDGTVVAWGDNSQGQTDVSATLTNVRFIAAGSYHSLASVGSPLLPYPVEAPKDLLLVYNTNSPTSVSVLSYYLQHRPLVGNANVVAVACDTNESILVDDYTNQIQTPLANWLAAHPTVRPGYVVLFPDLPARTYAATNFLPARPSVQVQIATAITNWHPLVTSINMGDTNACFAYIDKLAAIGSNYCPGQLILRAQAGGYGNTNYAIDNVRHGAGYSDNYGYCWWLGWAATNGLALNGIPSAAINYANGIETYTSGAAQDLPHLTNMANVAGYFTWGAHSSLGAHSATSGEVKFTGQSGWYVMGSVESFNGQRDLTESDNFVKWFSATAFGATNYQNTPVGAVTHVDEPAISGIEDQSQFFGLWVGGKNFATCAWASRNTPYFQAVGDPFVGR
jgi:alpha-tubulin suppressor-like RCC1 family protein